MVAWKDYGNFRRFFAGGGKYQQDLALGFGLALLPVNSLFLTADATWQAGQCASAVCLSCNDRLYSMKL